MEARHTAVMTGRVRGGEASASDWPPQVRPVAFTRKSVMGSPSTVAAGTG